jgi:hypothetical protein
MRASVLLTMGRRPRQPGGVLSQGATGSVGWGNRMRAQVGDRLLVGHGRQRAGLIIGVLRADGQPPYIVRWLSSGHIAMVFPDQYARIVPAGNALQD